MSGNKPTVMCFHVNQTGLQVSCNTSHTFTCALPTVMAPHFLDGIDGQRTLGDKAGLAGKRDLDQEDDFRTGLCVICEKNNGTHLNCCVCLQHNIPAKYFFRYVQFRYIKKD